MIKEDNEIQGGIKRSETNLIQGWLNVCKFEDIESEDVIRLDFEERTFAIYKTKEQPTYASFYDLYLLPQKSWMFRAQ